MIRYVDDPDLIWLDRMLARRVVCNHYVWDWFDWIVAFTVPYQASIVLHMVVVAALLWYHLWYVAGGLFLWYTIAYSAWGIFAPYHSRRVYKVHKESLCNNQYFVKWLGPEVKYSIEHGKCYIERMSTDKPRAAIVTGANTVGTIQKLLTERSHNGWAACSASPNDYVESKAKGCLWSILGLDNDDWLKWNH